MLKFLLSHLAQAITVTDINLQGEDNIIHFIHITLLTLVGNVALSSSMHLINTTCGQILLITFYNGKNINKAAEHHKTMEGK